MEEQRCELATLGRRVEEQEEETVGKVEGYSSQVEKLKADLTTCSPDQLLACSPDHLITTPPTQVMRRRLEELADLLQRLLNSSLAGLELREGLQCSIYEGELEEHLGRSRVEVGRAREEVQAAASGQGKRPQYTLSSTAQTMQLCYNCPSILLCQFYSCCCQ